VEKFSPKAWRFMGGNIKVDLSDKVWEHLEWISMSAGRKRESHFADIIINMPEL
jgi:hypothetical protein